VRRITLILDRHAANYYTKMGQRHGPVAVRQFLAKVWKQEMETHVQGDRREEGEGAIPELLRSAESVDPLASIREAMQT
jgi:hypothetical protein